MTLYDAICRYKSPYWPNYQDVLDPRYDYAHERVENNLPMSACDSYLGRLVSLAMCCNKYLEVIKSSDVDAYIDVATIFSATATITARRINPKLRGQLVDFLGLGLQAAWIQPLLSEYRLCLWTSKKSALRLNDPAYLNIVNELYAYSKRFGYVPLGGWFARNPGSTLPETQYEEVSE